MVTALAGAVVTWGPTVAAPYTAAAIRHPRRIALVDDHGSLTYRALELRSSRVALGLRAKGVSKGDTIGVLCRNHRGFVEANIAAAKLGARLVYLNTGLPDTQLVEVVDREQVSLVLADAELAPRLAASGARVIEARPDLDPGWTFPDLTQRRFGLLVPPRGTPDPVVLTSGTSGAPKGTSRSNSPRAGASALGFLEAIPYKRGDVFLIPAPLFHAWGLSQLVLAAGLAGTAVLRSSFDPGRVLDDLETLQVDVLAAVPVMLQRILALEPRRRPPRLRITASSGSALPGDLATRWMDSFGDNLYSVYGSTEVGQVSVAGPVDLRVAPDTAGRPLRGIGVRILGGDGDVLPTGDVGDIAVKSEAHFDGYTGGGSKPVVDGHMLIGDQGRVDADGRLSVIGRADDMIISGGENVYPANIERALLAHPAIHDVAVVGVPDDELGQRVRAVVVASEGDLSLDEVRDHLRPLLAPYELPRDLVVLDELPRNASGKILRTTLTDERPGRPR